MRTRSGRGWRFRPVDWTREIPARGEIRFTFIGRPGALEAAAPDMTLDVTLAEAVPAPQASTPAPQASTPAPQVSPPAPQASTPRQIGRASCRERVCQSV